MTTLIADCGSTKIEWALLHDGETNPITFKTTGFNAAVTPPEEINRILQYEMPREVDAKKVERIYFYGAGCIGGETDSNLKRLMSAIFPNSDIQIASDLLGAARALFGDGRGIACILGTGSNAGWYDGKKITFNPPPMGYILGDEGSGAVLGRTLINRIFKYPNVMPEDIIADFYQTYGLSKADIIEKVYRKPSPNRFLASLCPFIKKHIGCETVARIVSEGFQSFIDANGITSSFDAKEVLSFFDADDVSSSQTGGRPAERDKQVPVGFIGSIAYHFSDILADVCRNNDINCTAIFQSPLASLTAYHSIQSKGQSKG